MRAVRATRTSGTTPMIIMHHATKQAEPACERGDARNYRSVDTSDYPDAWWRWCTRCQNLVETALVNATHEHEDEEVPA